MNLDLLHLDKIRSDGFDISKVLFTYCNTDPTQRQRSGFPIKHKG